MKDQIILISLLCTIEMPSVWEHLLDSAELASRITPLPMIDQLITTMLSYASLSLIKN